MVRARWSSLSVIFDGTDEPNDGATVDINELFNIWQASDNKSRVICSLPLPIAQELTAHIYQNTEPHQPKPRKDKTQ